MQLLDRDSAAWTTVASEIQKYKYNFATLNMLNDSI